MAVLNYATDLIDVNSTTGSIKVAQSKSVGTYMIRVVGTLQDL